MSKQSLAILGMVITLFVLIASYYLVESSSFNQLISNLDRLPLKVRQMGSIGPLVIIGLMILAVVISPLPSAPVALALSLVIHSALSTLLSVLDLVLLLHFLLRD